MPNLATEGGEAVAPRRLSTKWPVFNESDVFASLETLISGRWRSLSHRPDTYALLKGDRRGQ